MIALHLYQQVNVILNPVFSSVHTGVGYYSFFQLRTHIYSHVLTHKYKNCTHNMQNWSHLLHLKYHKHISKANTFAIILITGNTLQ